MALQNKLFYLAGVDREFVKDSGIRSLAVFSGVCTPNDRSKYFRRIFQLHYPPVLISDAPDKCARFMLGWIARHKRQGLGSLAAYAPFDSYAVAVGNPYSVIEPHFLFHSCRLASSVEVVSFVASVHNIPASGIEAVLSIPEQKITIEQVRILYHEADELYDAARTGSVHRSLAELARHLGRMRFVSEYIKTKVYEPVITQLLESALSL